MIQCEGRCQYWYHYMCVAIDDNEYDYLSASEGKWECSACRKVHLPPLNSVDIFHFDFQNTTKTHCRAAVLCMTTLDLPLWYLFSIYQDNDSLHVA